jgi:hypothetical protein
MRNEKNTSFYMPCPFINKKVMLNNIIKYAGGYLLACLLAFCLAPVSPLIAQAEPAAVDSTTTDTTQVDTTEAATEEVAEEEAPGKIPCRISLLSTQLPGDTLELEAQFKAKVNNAWVPLKGFKIAFFAVGDENKTPLGNASTNIKGSATMMANTRSLALNAEGYLAFIARFSGNDQMEEAEGDVSVRKAILTMVPEKGDSIYTVTVKLVAPSAAGETPIAEAPVIISVQRLVGNLMIGEGTTDENGEAVIELAVNQLPGDDKGNLNLMAWIEDYEEYGNLAARSVQPWGVPVSHEVGELPRNLWSPNPPAWMVLTFLVLMVAVWGHYGVIVYKLNQINRLGK